MKNSNCCRVPPTFSPATDASCMNRVQTWNHNSTLSTTSRLHEGGKGCAFAGIVSRTGVQSLLILALARETFVYRSPSHDLLLMEEFRTQKKTIYGRSSKSTLRPLATDSCFTDTGRDTISRGCLAHRAGNTRIVHVERSLSSAHVTRRNNTKSCYTEQLY